jgi:hypothetical protein
VAVFFDGASRLGLSAEGAGIDMTQAATTFCWARVLRRDPSFVSNTLMARWQETIDRNWLMDSSLNGVTINILDSANTGRAATSGTVESTPIKKQWFTAAATFDGNSSTLYAYLDGVRGAASVFSPNVLKDSNTPWTLGGRAAADTFTPLYGYMAHAAIWSLALSPEEVMALALGASPLSIRRSALQSYWPLTVEYGVRDIGGGDNHLLVLTGRPRFTPDDPIFEMTRQPFMLAFGVQLPIVKAGFLDIVQGVAQPTAAQLEAAGKITQSIVVSYEALRTMKILGASPVDALKKLIATGAASAEALQTVSALSYSSTVLADGPAVYWKVDESAGPTAADSSGNGRDISYVGTGISYSQSPLIGTGTSVYLNSTFNNSYLTSSGSQAGINANNQVAVECWMKSTATPASGDAGQLVCADDTSGARFFQLRVNHSGTIDWIIFSSGGTTYSYTGTTVVNDGLPHHIVGLYDGTYSKLYIDGVADGAGRLIPSVTLPTNNPGVNIGRRFSSGSGQNFYQGYIDEIAIYTSALSPARISAHYTAGTGSGTGPVSVGLVSEALQGIAASGIDSLDALSGIRASAGEVLDVVQLLLASQVDPFEALQIVQASASDPLESIATAGAVSQVASLPVEALQSLAVMGSASAFEALQTIDAVGAANALEALRVLAIVGLADPYEALQKLAVTGPAPVDTLLRLAVAGSIDAIEALRGIAALSGSAADTLAGLRVVAATAGDTQQSVMQTGVSDAESQQSIQAAAVSFIESLRALSSTATFDLEALQLVRQFFGDPIESINQNTVSSSASFPFEILLGLAITGTSNAESERTVQATTQYPVEVARGIAALYAAPYGTLLGLSVIGAEALDTLKNLAATGQMSAESLLSVGRTATEVVEALAGLRATVTAPFSTLQTIRATIGSPEETQAIGNITQTASMPFEALQLAQNQTGAAAEAGRGIRTTVGSAYEALRALGATGAIRAESIKPVTQTGTLVAEVKQALQVVAGQGPVEALGGIRSRITSPAEAIATLHLLARLNLDTQGVAVRAMALLPLEALQKTSTTTRAPWEFFVFEKEGYVVLVDAATAEAILADEAVALALLTDAAATSAGLTDEEANWLGLTDEATGSAVLSDGED